MMNNPLSIEKESFSNYLLEHDHYTYPRTWNKLITPPILLSGHQAKKDIWQLQNSIQKTIKVRPDLYRSFQGFFCSIVVLLITNII